MVIPIFKVSQPYVKKPGYFFMQWVHHKKSPLTLRGMILWSRMTTQLDSMVDLSQLCMERSTMLSSWVVIHELNPPFSHQFSHEFLDKRLPEGTSSTDSGNKTLHPLRYLRNALPGCASCVILPPCHTGLSATRAAVLSFYHRETIGKAIGSGMLMGC